MAARILNHVSRALLRTPLHALIPRLTGGMKRGKGEKDEQERLMEALEEAARPE